MDDTRRTVAGRVWCAEALPGEATGCKLLRIDTPNSCNGPAGGKSRLGDGEDLPDERDFGVTFENITDLCRQVDEDACFLKGFDRGGVLFPCCFILA